MLLLAQRTKMCPDSTIWGDFGCGNPIVALEGSILAKLTFGIDLPSVMKQILSNLQNMKAGLMNNIHLIPCNILFMKASDFPSEFFDMTHLMCTIGIHPGFNFFKLYV